MAIEYDPTADYYVMLGIADNATADDIKKAHRERVRDLHPDRGRDSARATAVNLARGVLGEPSTRRAHDKARRAWFIEMLKDPTTSAFVDRDGLHAAHFAAQQRAQEAVDTPTANAPRATTTPVPSEERGHAPFADAARGLRRRVAVEELEGDRRVDVGDYLRGAGKELLEQAAQLIRCGDAPADEVVAHADQTAQRFGLVGQQHERTEAVTIGAQQVGEQVRIAEVGLALRGGVARPRRLDDAGMDPHDGELAFDECVDDEAGRPRDGDAQPGRRRQLDEPRGELAHARGGVCDGELRDDRTAHGVLPRGPVQTDEVVHDDCLGGRTSTDARGTCRALINRRSTACEPGRNILLSVKVLRSLRGGGSHSGRRAASERGCPRRSAGEPVFQRRRFRSSRQLFRTHDGSVH